ncbi:pantoate--beta-alanine ligase [Alistipes sp. OttesenSCG-928-B03]|nr:pantoate--beta-alanine ligase [Alistipes sp. OttesenSCG-928-B03]
MEIARTRGELHRLLEKTAPEQRGFVPTMGALHEGHVSLVERARRENGMVVVSVFVNPTQFNDPRDLERYPRTPDKDLRMLEQAGADIVFMPEVGDIYPETDTREFDFGGLDKVMEGATRPGHFNGVAQVVSRLFALVEPARAYFGEKDFQQIAVVCEMVRQLGMDVDIVPCPIVREADGLAMSSRNTLLDAQCRNAAPKIYAAMREGAARRGEATPREVEQFVTDVINSDPALEVIYFEVVDARTLQRVVDWNEAKDGIRGCVAVQAGAVRLIDNIAIV